MDSSTFVTLFELEEGIGYLGWRFPSTCGFLEQLKGRVDGLPVIEQLDVVGPYNLFGTQGEESAVRSVGRSHPFVAVVRSRTGS